MPEHVSLEVRHATFLQVILEIEVVLTVLDVADVHENHVQCVVLYLHAEGDELTLSGLLRESFFYPRPPRGGRHGISKPSFVLPKFLSAPSERRATKRGEASRRF